MKTILAGIAAEVRERVNPAEAIANFVLHYHAERNHQGMGNQLFFAGEEVGRKSGEIACRERLGRLLRYYYREAA